MKRIEQVKPLPRRSHGERLRILVLGYVVRCPLAGFTWADLHYAAGLRRLGHEVCFLEDSGDDPWSCYDPRTGEMGTDPTAGLAWARQVFNRAGMAQAWAYYDAHRDAWHGPQADAIDALCSSADLVVNVGGTNPMRPWLSAIPRRVFVDVDPVFQQVRVLTESARAERAAAHNVFLTYGANIGRPGCLIPEDKLPWQAFRPPIVLDYWPAAPLPAMGKLTTVMAWDSYTTRRYAGIEYGMKSASFGPYLDLPRLTRAKIELAVGGDAPRDMLREHGWHVTDPRRISGDLDSYQRYMRDSLGEFSVAKHGYVAARSGWFSERSAEYMASGRPVIVQDTGFSEWLPSSRGVLPFTNPAEALAAIDDVLTRPAEHADAARGLAHEYFDSDKVLMQLLDRAFAPPAPTAR